MVRLTRWQHNDTNRFFQSVLRWKKKCSTSIEQRLHVDIATLYKIDQIAHKAGTCWKKNQEQIVCYYKLGSTMRPYIYALGRTLKTIDSRTFKFMMMSQLECMLVETGSKI